MGRACGPFLRWRAARRGLARPTRGAQALEAVYRGARVVACVNAPAFAQLLVGPGSRIVILTVGAALESDYELYAHTRVGRLSGLSEHEIEAVTAMQAPDLPSQEEARAYEFTGELVCKHRIDSDAYAAAERAFGPKGLVDIVLLIGPYLATCSIINAFEVPVPQGVARSR